MRTRTRLTTPPGEAPSLSDRQRPVDETYVRGFALPEEPRVPGRRRRLWVTLAVLTVLAVVTSVTFLVITSGQSFDPALDLDAEQDADTVDTTTPDPEGTVPGDG